jgi:hypothetical protein
MAFQGDAFQSGAFQSGIGQFTLAATIGKTQSSSFSLDAELPEAGTFRLYALVLRGQPSTFTLDALLNKPTPSTFTLDGHLRKTQTASITLNAVVIRTIGTPPTQTFVNDTFTRSGSGNWGTASPTGGAWTNEAQANVVWSTDGSAGVVTSTPGFSGADAWVGSQSLGDRTVLFRAKAAGGLTSGSLIRLRLRIVDQATDAIVFADFRLAQTGSTDRVELGEVQTGGSATIYRTNFTSNNQWVWCKAEIRGINPTILRGKMWLDGDPEPVAWTGQRANAVAVYQSYALNIERAFDISVTLQAAITVSIDDVLVIEQTLLYRTVDAILKKTQAGVAFTLNAELRDDNWFNLYAFQHQLTTTSASIDALISERHFNLDAVILAQIFSDTFTRTVAKGLGGTWHFNPYNSQHFTDSQLTIASVDGSVAVFGIDQYETQAGIPVANTGDGYFDALAPITVANQDPFYGLLLEPWDYLGIYVRWTNSTTIRLGQFGANPDTNVTVTAGSWYRIHARWTQTRVYINAWLRSSAEPAGWQYDQSREFVGIGTSAVPNNDRYPPMLDVFSSPPFEVGQLDNVEIWSSSSTWRGYNSFQIDAQIRRNEFFVNAQVAFHHFRLNAVILKHQGPARLTGAALIVADTPTAYWRLGETSGVFVDTMVGNDGTAQGTVTRGASGFEADDAAILLNGTGYVRIPDSADMDFTSPFSIEAWVKVPGAPSGIGFSGTIYGKGNNTPLLWLTGNGNLPAGRVALSKNNVADNVVTSALIIDSNWHHIIAVYQHNIIGKIYVDGVDAGGAPNYVAFAAGSVAAAWGSKTGASVDQGLTGSLDEVAVYNYILTPAQVAEHYARAGQIRFSVNAFVSLDAIVAGSFTVNAQILGHGTGSFTINAITRRVTSGLVLLQAHIVRNAITVDAQIQAGGLIRLNALIVAHSGSKTFTVDAYLTNGTTKVFTGRTINAVLRKTQTTSFTAYAELAMVVTTHTGSKPVDAICLERFSEDFTLAAELDSGHRTGSFTVNADLKGQNEQRGTFTLNAVLRRHVSGLVMVEAQIGGKRFRLDAKLAGRILLNAELVRPPAHTASFTVNAVLYRLMSGSYTLDAVMADANGAFANHIGSFTANAQVLSHIGGAPPIWLDAVIYASSPHSFTVDARVAGSHSFTVDAFIRTTFTVNAYIRGNATIVYPDDGGPPLDPEGNPWPDWFKASRKYRIRITLDGVDVTGDVNFSRTSFVQNAKTGPGTFELVLYGQQPYIGGEEIHVEIDDLRTFGGYVMTVEAGYVFAATDTSITTTLRGTDYNVLFDRLFAYNKASASGSQGKYTTWKSFAKGTYDDTIIRKVFGSYVDLPPGFDYTTYVDRVGVAALEEPWTMATAGSSLRQTMQSLSQVTTAVWWIDPYLHLHNHSRSTITAPYPITDGKGGISSKGLSISGDISQMVNQAIVWGTLARTVEGEINAQVNNATTSREQYGRWQYGEFRSDLHHTNYIQRRAASIIERYRDPIYRAKAFIFEPGYQAGQGVEVISSEHGISDVLVIHSMALTFAVAKERDGDTYYGVPRYELSIGLDPELPWDIYDYLPFNWDTIPWDPYWVRCEDCCFEIEGCVDSPLCPDGSLPPCGEACIEATYSTDEFNRTVNRTGPFTTTSSLWGGSWVNVAEEVYGDLYFPGEDYPNLGSGSQRLNKVSDFIPDNTTVHINFVTANAGSGYSLDTHGVMGAGINTWRHVVMGGYSINTSSASTNNNHIYYYFGGQGGVYNPNLTGSGTYHFTPPTFGAAGSFSSVNTTTRRASVTVNNSQFGVRLPYSASSSVNRNSTTGTFEFWLGALPAGAEWSIEYGAATVEFDPDADEVRLVSSSGTVSAAWTDWNVSASGPGFVLEVTLDLDNSYVRARLSREGGASIEIESTSSALLGNDDYLPEIQIYWWNLTATNFIWEMTALRSTVWEDATSIIRSDTSALFDFTDTAAWTEWIDFPNVGDHARYTYGADGTITLHNGVGDNEGNIRREITGGAVDVAFCISDYATHPTRYEVIYLFFGTSAPNNFNPFHYASIGNDAFVQVGSGTGSFSPEVITTLFTVGNPVNVRIAFNGGGMHMKLWAGGTAEPEDWLVEVFKTTAPWPDNFLGIYMASAFNDGESVRLGPLQLPSGESPSYLLTGSAAMAAPGAPVVTTSNPAYGRRREYPFTNPGGFAGPFGSSVYVREANSLPFYHFELEWPVFGPAPGNGITRSVIQEIAAVQFGALTSEGVNLEYNVRVRGTVTITLGEALYGGVGATGIPGPVYVRIDEYSYGKGEAVVGGVDNPPYIDYNILNGTMKWGALFDQVTINTDQSMEFNVLMSPFIDENGVRILQWGGYFYGTEDPTHDAIEQAGPLWGGATFITPNNGSMNLNFGNVTYEIVPSAIGYAAESRADPCPEGSPFEEGFGDHPDPEGETFGVVNEGWGCETIKVVNHAFVATGLVTKDTLNVYDADTGAWLEPHVEWIGHGNGKDFDIPGNHDRVTACYRNYIVNAKSQTTQRVVTPNAPREQRYLPP